jgi:hypothetical protein
MTEQATKPFALEVTSGPIATGTREDFELAFSRRALARLKARLGRQGLEDLLAPDIEEGIAFLRDMANRSDGKWKPATTELTVRGISTAQFLGWFHDNMPNEAAMLASEPEHFVITANDDGTSSVVENIGPYVGSFTIHFTGEEEAVGDLLPEYPIRMVGHTLLADDTVTMHVLHQFGDTEQGFKAHLTIFFPAAFPDEIIEQHRQHLAVEFGNWVTAAAS